MTTGFLAVMCINRSTAGMTAWLGNDPNVAQCVFTTVTNHRHNLRYSSTVANSSTRCSAVGVSVQRSVRMSWGAFFSKMDRLYPLSGSPVDSNGPSQGH
ncbi:MAG: hypothetical protein AB4042_02700 [Leptolyngbyaceae cyanobacterium]